ncbi:MAG: bifunctional hydroxymethylpyrimidine kinase/phosphomethylpyrimidine kinase [Syntrophus sp. (in: bacteria)]|nr:bifunctional hydroxymethylpyrimidine kinase/phosphomethylpyrimidine kinase [Syntrophus sp. (in: bacteria)]
MNKILTIAGYDSSSGAGITRDLDVFFSLAIHGLSVPTATVLQGPQGVEAVYPTPEAQFIRTLQLIGRDIDIQGVKIGVVWDRPYCEEIARFLEPREGMPVVIDPVGAAKNGIPLITEKGLSCLVDSLFPLAWVVTPNIPEAALLTGKAIDTVEDMKKAAQAIHGMGPRSVIVKGGHLVGEPVDLLFDGSEFFFFEKQRIDREVHGTGCIFSSALTAFLVLGHTVREAFFAAQAFMTDMLKESYRIDEAGYFYASPGIMNSNSLKRWR